jgi:thiosulfate reductase / polysulfide reductase chain A
MRAIEARHGPEAVALFSHGIGGNFLKHTLRAFGTPNISAPSFAQCRGPRDVGFQLTFGEDVGSPERTDIRDTRCLVLLGSHLGENMHNTQVQEFAEAVGRGATVIVVDPRFSIAAGKAKHYLPDQAGHRPRAAARVDARARHRGALRPRVRRAHGFGFEAFAAEIAPLHPGVGLPRNRHRARRHPRDGARDGAPPAGDARPPGPPRHVVWRRCAAEPRHRAPQRPARQLGTTGGFYTPASLDVPAYPYPPYPTPARGKADNPDGRYPFATETITTGIREATLTDTPYPVRGWLVYATNLLQALPNQAETIAAIQRLDLLVVVDVVPSEIAGWADVVLPEAVYLERHDDLNVEWFREPFVALRQPVVDAPHDQKPNWWIARELALKLGLGRYYPWTHIEEYLETRLSAAGLSFDVLKTQGILRGAPRPSSSTRACRRNSRRPRAESSSTPRNSRHAGSTRCPGTRRRRRRLRAASGCCSADRPSTRSHARRPTRSSPR